MRKPGVVFRKQTLDMAITGYPRGELSLHGGTNGYLRVGPVVAGAGAVYALSGRATLRRLARAILRRIPAPAKKAKVKR